MPKLPPKKRRTLAEVVKPVMKTSGIKVIKIIKNAPPETGKPSAVPPLGEEAYHGLIGSFLRGISPYTEATDAGILAHLLPACGITMGPRYGVNSGSRQPARLNTVVVGNTNSARKGTASGVVDTLMEQVDPDFWAEQRVSGLSSGEGLIVKVADIRKTDENGDVEKQHTEKRLFVLEEEFKRVLDNMARNGNILSSIIRNAFDTGHLCTLTVNPRQAMGAHIGIVAHITPEELEDCFNDTEKTNGFGNRFCWLFSESTKLLPRTVPIPNKVFQPLVKRLRTLHLADSLPDRIDVDLDENAQLLWEELYPKLREDRPGIAGAMIARGSSMVMRMALIFAVLDRDRPVIRVPHLKAAMAVWQYCEATANYLFSSATGDKLCDKIVKLLKGGPMTKNELNKHFSVKQKSEVNRALNDLEEWKVLKQSIVQKSGAGRPATKWELIAEPTPPRS